jgi:hypothetical protein
MRTEVLHDILTGGVPTRRPGNTNTHSRPDTNDKNLLSEAQFQILKYRPGFSEHFGSLADARVFCRECIRVIIPLRSEPSHFDERPFLKMILPHK